MQRYILRFLLTFFFSVSFTTLVTRGADVGTLKAGFAKANITPTRPTPMAGYYHERLSSDTHDPLWAKVTVLDDSTARVAIVTLDLISTNVHMVRETRRAIEEQTGIKSNHVMISATHSHTGPMLFNPSTESYSRFGSSHDSSKQYMFELPGKIAAATKSACESLVPIQVTQATTLERNLGFNRRFFMKDGTVGWNPGKRNPNIVREAGPTDDELNYLCFYNEQNQLIALHANFSIHLDTVGGTLWSADMPYTFEKNLQEVYGEGLHVQYMTGCCGDVNHIDVRSSLAQKGDSEAARIGTRLASAVMRSFGDQQPIDGANLIVSKEDVMLSPRPHDEVEAQWARTIMEKANSPNMPPFMDMVRAFRIFDTQQQAGIDFQVEVSTITLGNDVAWVFLPGEIFVQLGMDIKSASPFRTTLIPELANGSIGYVPTRQAYPQGNYEVVSARCDVGCGEKLVDSAIAQLMKHFQRSRTAQK